MPGGFSHEEEKMISNKADSGELAEDESGIEPVSISFSHFDFPELKEEKPGRPVVVVLRGYVSEVRGAPMKDKEGQHFAMAHDSYTTRVRFSKASVVHGKMPTLGSGERFQRLEDALEKRGARSPGGLAAFIGRKKYGKER